MASGAQVDESPTQDCVITESVCSVCSRAVRTPWEHAQLHSALGRQRGWGRRGGSRVAGRRLGGEDAPLCPWSHRQTTAKCSQWRLTHTLKSKPRGPRLGKQRHRPHPRGTPPPRDPTWTWPCSRSSHLGTGSGHQGRPGVKAAAPPAQTWAGHLRAETAVSETWSLGAASPQCLLQPRERGQT